MSERGYVSKMLNEIWTKAEIIPDLSEDERAYVFRTYKFLYSLRSYKIMPLYLSTILALTICFVTSGFFLNKLGASDPRLAYLVIGSFIVYFATIFAFLKITFYNPLIRAEISGFKFVMDHDPRIKPIVEVVKTKDPAAAKNINKYLLS